MKQILPVGLRENLLRKIRRTQHGRRGETELGLNCSDWEQSFTWGSKNKSWSWLFLSKFRRKVQLYTCHKSRELACRAVPDPGTTCKYFWYDPLRSVEIVDLLWLNYRISWNKVSYSTAVAITAAPRGQGRVFCPSVLTPEHFIKPFFPWKTFHQPFWGYVPPNKFSRVNVVFK